MFEVAQALINWHTEKILKEDRIKIDHFINVLFSLALKFEVDDAIDESADLDSIALFDSAATVN